jgi:hypothetical protein
MRTVYKFTLAVVDESVVPMPQGSELLTVQCQGGQPCLWALVETDRASVKRKIAIRGTGHQCDELVLGQYVDTFQLHGGALVFHVFDRGES